MKTRQFNSQQPELKIKKIIDHRNRGGRLKFKITWLNYDIGSQWVDTKVVEKEPEKLKDYLEKMSDRRSSKFFEKFPRMLKYVMKS
jgi:hypothetical protein